MIVDSPPFIFQVFMMVHQITGRPETVEEDTFNSIAVVDWEGYRTVGKNGRTWNDLLEAWPKETIDAFIAHVKGLPK